MFYILIIFLVISFILDKLIYIICKEMEYSIYNTILVYSINIIIPLFIYHKYGLTDTSINYFFLVPFIVIIFIIDFRTSFVYDITVVSGIILQGILFVLIDVHKYELLNHIQGLIIGMILSFFIYKFTKAIAQGDIGVYGLCSFVLGIDKVLNLFMLSFFITCIFAVLVILKNKNFNLKIKIPFTPFIFTATFLIILLQYDIIKIYFEILI